MKTIGKTTSICHICGVCIEAEYMANRDGVYIVKSCPKHGQMKVRVGEDLESFDQWVSHVRMDIPPQKTMTESGTCPSACGYCGEHRQSPCCILLDVTDRCNQSCPFCFSNSRNGKKIKRSDIPMAEIEKRLDFLTSLGEEKSFNIQISGGEPTVRDDLNLIVEMVRVKGFEYVQINTNGKRLAEDVEYVRDLKDAGLSAVFLQFDGVGDQIYRHMRGEDLLAVKASAIENCRLVGLPVTLVPTLTEGVNVSDIGNIVGFAVENIDVVKGVHFQPVSYFGRHPGDRSGRVTMFKAMDEIARQVDFVNRDDFAPVAVGHPLCSFFATYMQIDGRMEKVEGSQVERLESMKSVRNYMKSKWVMASKNRVGRFPDAKNQDDDRRNGLKDQRKEMSFDDFLETCRRGTLTITGMAFQDVENLDLDRLKRCRVGQLVSGDRIVPFCAYNNIYREVERV